MYLQVMVMKSLAIDSGSNDKNFIKSRNMIFIEEHTIKDFDKVEKSKSDVRSYIDVVPKSYNENFVDTRDIQVDAENVTNEQ